MKAEQVKLNLLRTGNEQGYGIEFDASTPDEIRAYNKAIRDVLLGEKLMPRHAEGEEDKGRQVWDAMAVERQDELEKMLPNIHKRAQDYMEAAKFLRGSISDVSV